MAAVSDFQRFASRLQASNGRLIAPDRFADALHLRQQELADFAGVHRTTVAAAPVNAKLQQFMRDTLRVLSAAAQVNPDFSRAIDWYRNAPIPEFGQRTAEQLVAAGKSEAVASYLISTQSGSTG